MTSRRLDPELLLALARKCRKYAKSLKERNNVVMLRLWAAELADQADKTERQQTRSGLRHLRARARRGAIVRARRRRS
jgi:hypothetical protein